MTKNAPFGPEIVTFLSWLFDYVEKRFDKKATLLFEIYNVTDWQQIITIYILPTVSRRKGNQTLKFGLLIEYNMRNILLEKLYTKYVGEDSSWPFYLKKSKFSISLDQQSKML